MKILNRKLTIVDFAILIGGLIAIAFVFFLLFRRSTYISVTLKVGSDNINWKGGATKAWFSQFFYVGMKQLDGFGRPLVEVTDIYSYDTSPDSKAVYVTVRIKTVYNRASNQYTFNGKPVLIGSFHRLYLDKVLVEGLVTRFEGMQDVRERKKMVVEAEIREENPVFAETSGVRPYIADQLHEGEEIKDDQGNVVVKILKKNVSPAKRNLLTSDGRIINGIDVNRQDVSYTLELNAIKILNRYYVFDDVPVLVGWNVPLNTSEVSLFPEVTKIVQIK